MSTIASIPTPALSSDPASDAPGALFFGPSCIVFRGVSWEAYESLSRAQGEGNHVRLAYDGEDLEIMTTSYVHENLKKLAGNIAETVMSWRDIDHVSAGEATLNAAGARRGLQADLAYCFDPDKVRRAREALARGSLDPADYPAPDLAVEIDVSPSDIDRPAIYAALRVAEVWRIQRDRKVIIEHLRPDGSYAPAEASRFLGITAAEIQGWLTAEDVGREAAWFRRLNQWAMGLGRMA
jgi:Uma2 family endonuclease